ncbi:MAG: hypothetical protein US50_C0054G0005 [Candidatus Nomurabacteria bacterium GW2011_GWB1_37_5]|uniref:NYN domain-containing protein n=1 Tax=Candidatus Nomurabacteria bacterium GW2011_GWB1_37_5 TaxID=1618742 RepID=A0A0G0GW53_9BACT|nr:MAG: hypothetical protein US50_C0054G0005 [Candidatus Nomurabacteria bacterium GW2011_GWB1_37_5]
MKKKKLNNYAFIDSQNLYLGVKSQGWKLDYARFRVYLKEKYQVNQAFIFIGYVTGNESLYTALQHAGYIGVFKPTLPIKKGNKVIIKGNVDAELVLHTMVELPNYDKVVIVSGDGDFHCLLEYLDKEKKLLKLLVPNERGFSRLLRKFRKYVVFLHDLREKVEYRKHKKERE